MGYEDDLKRLRDRLDAYNESRRPELVLAAEAGTEANALLESARPADLDRITREEAQRLGTARLVVGWLSFFRYLCLPEGMDQHDLALTVLMFNDLVETTTPIPIPGLLGPDAVPGDQVGVASGLLQFAIAADDLLALEAATVLLLAAQVEEPELRARSAADLATTYAARFRLTGQPIDLDLAIEAAEPVLVALLGDDPVWVGVASGAVTMRLTRFGSTGAREDLDRAVEIGEEACHRAAPDHPLLATVLSTLSLAYQTRFEQFATEADLERAISTGEDAIAAMTAGEDMTRLYLSSLSPGYRARFERGGAVEDVDRAIELGERVLSTAVDVQWQAELLATQSAVYQARFVRNSIVADLDQAILFGERIVAVTEDEQERARHLSDLGAAYRTRFDRTGVSRDLDRAVELGAQALVVNNHRRRAAHLTNLASSLLLRFNRAGLQEDLEHAVVLGEESVALGSDFVASHANLALIYNARHRSTGAVPDLDRALELGERALELGVGLPFRRPGLLSDLAITYAGKYQANRVPDVLDRAIALSEQALAGLTDTPDQNSRAGYVANLVLFQLVRLEQEGVGITSQELHDILRHVAVTSNASPERRVSLGTLIGGLALKIGERGIAVDQLDAAIALLPSVSPRESDWGDQEHRLGKHLGLVSEAVAAHCALGDPAGAVEAAEQGRGVILAAQLDARGELGELDDELPELAAGLRKLRADLAAPRHEEQRRRSWAEYDDLLSNVRQHPGFARFGLPPRLADLSEATAGGCAVLVNAGAGRGDAIIVTADDEPIHVELPDLGTADVRAVTSALLDTTHDNSLVAALRRRRLFPELLAWLWDAIAEPVLAALPHRGPVRPRVWWMPTGLLGLLPLHAAGHPGQEGALDRVVSSYTPTLRVLAHSVARPPVHIRRQLTIAMPHTPGLPDLPGTVAETADLRTGTPPLTDRDATVAGVTEALRDATWAHFACHASADLVTPSHGGLQLFDGTLQIPRIGELVLEHAEIAYLSACSTANRGWRPADESIHLASAFQLAGFRHVVGSLWPVVDQFAADAARRFYRALPRTASTDRAAVALNLVTREVRAQHPEHPDWWAALVHSGA